MPRKRKPDAAASSPDLSIPNKPRVAKPPLSPAARELADLLAAVVAERLTQKNQSSDKEPVEHDGKN